MIFAIGDILSIFSPLTGYDKYHLCLYVGSDGEAHKFLFLNSDPNYADTFAVACKEIPCLPPSDTGVSVLSFSMIPRYTDKQLRLYKAKVLGRLDSGVAARALEVAQTVKALTRAEKDLVISALRVMQDGAPEA